SYIILMVLITGAVFGLLTLLLLERFVLSRLANLTNAVMHIGISSDPTARVPVGALDELGELAMTINVMLQALEQSRDELALAHSHLARVARLAAAGEIAAGVAHQINNPLTAVVAESYLLLQEMEENTPEHESVTIIQEAARRAGDVVQQLLNLARSIPFDMTPLDVNASLTNAISLVRAQIEPHIAQIHASLANDLPPILGSPQHLEDVWINLFLNARDAVRDVSEAVIQVMTAPGSTDGEITITITDNGAGIAPQDLSHIFDPFYTTKQHGTGLGLSICHDVIERHGGAIGVESEDGLGTTFIITLPAAPADAAELSG
ncbi:MAG: HAMP domain-containing protein, partial [Anaerolineae bacterium]|nr:HAMP domain-containing protein [Anaerolineae bacterium]